ncbi:MAG: hypothetical protein U9Q27_00145 [Patescibacteria group bacterium]|nr:hypothetical protein [Patescibacteria group bacterium]
MQKPTVVYKGIEVPAKTIKLGNNVSKLIPISTNQYTLYGVPRPQNADVSAKTILIAKDIIRKNKETIGSKKTILAKYIRKITTKRPGQKGMPIGILVAFIYNNELLIGWSKYLEGKETVINVLRKNGVNEVIKSRLKEPLVFTKKDAMLLAVERGLTDIIAFHGSNTYTKRKKVIPKNIAKELDKFINRCEKYFKRNVSNITTKLQVL